MPRSCIVSVILRNLNRNSKAKLKRYKSKKPKTTSRVQLAAIEKKDVSADVPIGASVRVWGYVTGVDHVDDRGRGK